MLQLYVHKSGHARLVIGGVSLSVQSGLAVSFVEEGVSIDAGSQKSFCSFGQVRTLSLKERVRIACPDCLACFSLGSDGDLASSSPALVMTFVSISRITSLVCHNHLPLSRSMQCL